VALTSTCFVGVSVTLTLRAPHEAPSGKKPPKGQGESPGSRGADVELQNESYTVTLLRKIQIGTTSTTLC